MRTISISTGDLTPAKADFLTLQCEKALQRTLDDREAIHRKGAFVLGILSAVIAFGINSLIGNMAAWPMGAIAYLVSEIAILAILALPVIWGYLPSAYAGHGYDPSRIFKGDYVNQSVDKMKVGYAHELQSRITYNRKWNTKTAIRLKWIASAAVASPVASLLVVVILRRVCVIP